jgi:ribosomal protein S18 acetylase RimI-like enzyme
MIIRAAEPPDLDEMARLTRDALSFASSPDLDDWESASDKDIRQRLHAFVQGAHGKHGASMVVEVESRVVGFVACRFGEAVEHAAHRSATIEVLAVAPDMRARGLGTQLILELKRVLPGMGIMRLHVDVLGANEPAVRFWRRAGFHDLAIRMCSDLASTDS